MSQVAIAAPPTAEQSLLRAFDRAGRIRFPNPDVRANGVVDHKGVEVRLRARDDDELDDLRYALNAVGLTFGRPYSHGRGWVIPLYGKVAVQWFLARRPGTDRVTRHQPRRPPVRRRVATAR
jgi:hypothetical protein